VRRILIRHCEAVPEGPGLDDPHRYLTNEGRRQARAVGHAFRGQLPARVLTSPLTRTLQTAELIVRGAESDALVESYAPLAHSAGVRAVEAYLRDLDEDIVLVGHEPGISGLAAVLTGTRTFPAFTRGQALVVDHGRATEVVRPGDPAPRPFDEASTD
jgi:phosphohistidine phosphatase SixA